MGSALHFLEQFLVLVLRLQELLKGHFSRRKLEEEIELIKTEIMCEEELLSWSDV